MALENISININTELCKYTITSESKTFKICQESPQMGSWNATQVRGVAG